MQTQLSYLDVAAGVLPPTNMTASYVEVVGMDIVISLLIMISVLLTIITFYTMRTHLRS